MPCTRLVGLLAAALLSAPATAQDGPVRKWKTDAIPGYKIMHMGGAGHAASAGPEKVNSRGSGEGFTVIVSDEAIKQDAASRLDRKPLDALRLELKTLSGLMPAKTLSALHNVLIWVEWNEEVKFSNGRTGQVLATYYGGHQLDMLAKGMHPLKAKNITIHRLESLAREHQPKNDSGRCVVLHEMVHAVQDQVLGNNNASIKAAYKQAMERNLLDKKAYAATNELEFFAEMTCAYFDQLDYYPHNNKELKKLDPTTYKLLESIWGKPKPGTTPGAAHGGPDSDLLLAKVKLGKSVAGPKVTPDDLKGRPVLLVLWNAGSTSSLTFLTKATAWDAELGDFGLATVGVHMTGNKPQDVAAVAKAHGLAFAVTETPWDSPALVKEAKDFPVGLVFGRDGHCAYRGPAFDAEQAVRAKVGEALAAAAGLADPPKGVVPVLESLRKGKAPPSVLPRLATLARSPDADTAAAAKAIAGAITAGGRKAVEEAEAMAKDDPVGAYLRVEHVPAVYKETAVATKAANLIARLKADRAVATEVRARARLAILKKIDTELGSRPGSFDPSQKKFRRDNAELLLKLEEGVALMKKSWPKARATEEAQRLAEKYAATGR
jgi:hypothetical protein